MRIWPAAALALILSANLGLAETSVSELSHSELVNLCVKATNRGVNAEIYAAELVQRDKFHLGPKNKANGKRCLEETYETEFVFEGGRYVSPMLAASLQRRAQLAEEQQQERERQYENAVIDACLKEYEVDRFRALTTPICGPVFKAVGLPKSR